MPGCDAAARGNLRKMSLFQTTKEIDGNLSRQFGDKEMFPDTLQFQFLDPENGHMRTEIAQLGRGIEIWRVLSSGHEIELNEPSRLTYLLPLAGKLEVSSGSNEYSAAAGDGLLLSPNRRNTRVTATTNTLYDALVILMPEANIRTTLDRQELVYPNFNLDLPATGELGASLRDYLLFIAREFTRPESPFTRQAVTEDLATILEELFIDLTSNKEHGNGSATARSASADHVRRAEEILRVRFDEAVPMTEVSDTLGISLRALQLAFREYRGYAPREALTRIRLEEAHRRLIRADGDFNISRIAMDCGFTHMGRFSKLYRETYGLLPSETVRSTASPA